MIVSLLLQNWPHEQQSVIEISLLCKHELKMMSLISPLDAPKETNITTNLPQDTVDDGSLITITCKALGNPPPSYKFFINDNPIMDKKFETSGILTITAMGFKQKGIYSCRPENNRGTGPISEVAVYVRCK